MEQLDYGARYYEPSVGRFTGVDPISDQFPELSTYNYASNNPSTNVDLWGLQGYHSSRAFMLKTMKKNGASNKAMQIASSTYDNAAKGTAVTIAGALSPVDEVSLTLGAARRIPGVGGLITKAGSAISKLADDAWSGLKGLFKSRDEIGDLASGVSKNIHSGKQGKHIPGHNNFIEGRSELTGDAHTLLDDFHVGNVKSAKKINDDKTRVDFGKEIGSYVDPETGEKTGTTIGIVINSKSGSHIIPARPKIENP